MPRKNILTALIFLAVCGLGVFGGAIKVSATEFLGRGLLCLPKDGSAYCSWRLLPIDAPTVGFDVYRDIVPTGSFAKVNGNAITASTNFHDTNAQSGTTYYYKIKPVGGEFSEIAKVTAGTTKKYLDIPIFDSATTIHSVVPADLNGDGVWDFVIKTPNWDACHQGGVNVVGNSNTPTKVSALINKNGVWETKWTKDILFKECNLGEDFSVNPLLVGDLDGDKKAEIVLRYGVSGEKLAILDGMTGEIRESTGWPLHNPPLTTLGDTSLDRHYANITYLRDMTGDGIADPFIVIQNGLYGSFQRFTAYYFNGISLELINDLPLRGEYFGSRSGGMGTHGLPSSDIDLDGKDEIIPCGGAIDDDFAMMWEAYNSQHVNTKHNDACYSGDMRTDLPGLEIFMGEEGHNAGEGYAMLADAQGRILWRIQADASLNYDGWTQGWCAELSKEWSGLECVAQGKDEENENDATTTVYIFNFMGTNVTSSFPSAFYPPPRSDMTRLHKTLRQAPLDWTQGEGVKELYFHGAPSGNPYSQEYAGWYHTILADIMGDSREEVVGFNKEAVGFFRITSNTEPNEYRKVTPLTDRDYRAAIARVGVGYRTNYVPSVAGTKRIDVVYSLNPPTCASFQYAEEECQPNGTQKVNIVSALPAGCAGGIPITSKSCNYLPPIRNEVDAAGTYFDAENFTRTVTAQNNGTFSTETAGSFFNGSGYLKSTGAPGEPAVSERKEYDLYFPTAGKYTVWIRGHCVSGDPSNGDSVYFGLNGVKLGAIKEYSWVSDACRYWEWANYPNNASVDINTITINTPGNYVFNIWSRESGHLLDGIFLTHSELGKKRPTDFSHGKIIDPSGVTGNPADVNSDGHVNIKDIQACIKVITGSDMTYENQCKVLAAPIGNTNIKDIQIIIRKIINP